MTLIPVPPCSTTSFGHCVESYMDNKCTNCKLLNSYSEGGIVALYAVPNPFLLNKICSNHLNSYDQFIIQLEALGERWPPWLRQIITPILSTVKMLSLASERLTPKVLDHYLHHDLVMLPLLCRFYCSFTHPRIPRSPWKLNQFFIVLPRTLP